MELAPLATPPLCTQPSCTISIVGPFLHFFCSCSWEHNSSNLQLLHSKIPKVLCFKACNRFLILLRVVCCICIVGTCTVMVPCDSLLLYRVVNADETGHCWVFFLGTIFDFSGYCQTSGICLHTALIKVVHSTNRMVKELFWSQALQLN